MEKYIEIKTLKEANPNEEICAVYQNPNYNIAGKQNDEKLINAEKDAVQGKCKLYVWREINNSDNTQFQQGYQQAMNEINTPMSVIIESQFSPSLCPRCKADFKEECNDGYYYRAIMLSRCDKCGQKLDWMGVNY